MTIKVGDRVTQIYTGDIGTIVNIWDGKYTCSYYVGGTIQPI